MGHPRHERLSGNVTKELGKGRLVGIKSRLLKKHTSERGGGCRLQKMVERALCKVIEGVGGFAEG